MSTPIMTYRAVLLGGLLLGSALAAAQPIEEPVTEERALALLERMETAIGQRDADALRAVFAPDARIEISEIADSGEKREVYDPDRYVTDTRLGWKLAADYQYRIDRRILSLSPDGLSAEASLDVTESREVMGETRVKRSSQALTIAVRDGGLLVTRMNSRELPATSARGEEKSGLEAAYDPSAYDYSALVEPLAIEALDTIDDAATGTRYHRYRITARVVDHYKGRLPGQLRYVSTSAIERPLKITGELRIVNLCKTRRGTYFLPDVASALEATPPLVRYAKANAGSWPESGKSRACSLAAGIFVPKD